MLYLNNTPIPKSQWFHSTNSFLINKTHLWVCSKSFRDPATSRGSFILKFLLSLELSEMVLFVEARKKHRERQRGFSLSQTGSDTLCVV